MNEQRCEKCRPAFRLYLFVLINNYHYLQKNIRKFVGSLSPTTSLLLVHQCFNPSLPSNLPPKRGGLPKRNAEELDMTQYSLSKRWASISDHKTLPPCFPLRKIKYRPAWLLHRRERSSTKCLTPQY